MTKRKLLYAIVISFILITIAVYFIFLMPRQHIYSATLASNPKSVYQMAEMLKLYP